jgi:hypothetical protein
MIKRFITSFICITMVSAVYAAVPVKRISPVARASVAGIATKPKNGGSAIGAVRSATKSVNSRLSASSFLSNNNKVNVSTPGGGGGGDVDLSDYATLDQVDALELFADGLATDIDNISDDIAELPSFDDVYTKTEIDDIVNNLEITGAPGAKGDKGDKGDTGDDGLSAYEIAQLNGFVGTESQWLASLKGADGVDGSGLTCDSSGNGTYMISVVGGVETCVSVDTTGDTFSVVN